MKTIDFSFFIERYNAGEMDETEKLWFKKEMVGNENLRKEVELRQKTEDILKKQDIINLRTKLCTIEKSRETSVLRKKRIVPVYFKYAAVVAFMIVTGGIFILTENKPDNDEILEKYIKPYEATSSVRSDKVTSNPDFNLALEYYEIHDYRNAAIYFNRTLADQPGDMQSTLLKGISNFEIRNYPEAEESFVKVIDDNKNLYIDHAQWYLSLCYIKTDEREKATELLAIIEKSKSIYNKNAKKILRNLK